MKYYGKIQSPQDLITKKYCEDYVFNIAKEYEESKTYDINDMVFYNRKLYKCNTDGTTGTWDSSKWDSIKVSEDFVLDGPLLRDDKNGIHPQTQSVDFGDVTAFPTYDDIETYVNDNPDQIVSMSSMYSLISRLHDRFISGDILGMSLLKGDTEFGGVLMPANDVTLSGDTMVIP